MKFDVNLLNCYLIGNLYKGFELKKIQHCFKQDVPRFDAIWTELLFVSICHQTNWDKLHNHVWQLAQKNPEKLRANRLSEITVRDFELLFAPGLDPKRMKISERHRIVTGLANKFLDIDTRWLMSDETKLSDIYRWLDNFESFSSDPLKKKSRIFIHQLLLSDTIIMDEHSMVLPAVDYHLIRLYLRTNRVARLREEEQEEPDREIRRIEYMNNLRKSVESAMQYTSYYSGISIEVLNFIEWQIARSYCDRTLARCSLKPLQEKPFDDTLLKFFRSATHCPLSDVCYGAIDKVCREIVEPSPSSIYSFY